MGLQYVNVALIRYVTENLIDVIEEIHFLYPLTLIIIHYAMLVASLQAGYKKPTFVISDTYFISGPIQL